MRTINHNRPRLGAISMLLLLPVLLVSMLLGSLVNAQAAFVPKTFTTAPIINPHMFAEIGFIQEMTLNEPAYSEWVATGAISQKNVLVGGTVTVNGKKIIIPDNTIVTLPANFATWAELWSLWHVTVPASDGPAANLNIACPLDESIASDLGAAALDQNAVYVDIQSVQAAVQDAITFAATPAGALASPALLAALPALNTQLSNCVGQAATIASPLQSAISNADLVQSSCRLALTKTGGPIGAFGSLTEGVSNALAVKTSLATLQQNVAAIQTCVAGVDAALAKILINSPVPAATAPVFRRQAAAAAAAGDGAAAPAAGGGTAAGGTAADPAAAGGGAAALGAAGDATAAGGAAAPPAGASSAPAASPSPAPVDPALVAANTIYSDLAGARTKLFLTSSSATRLSLDFRASQAALNSLDSAVAAQIAVQAEYDVLRAALNETTAANANLQNAITAAKTACLQANTTATNAVTAARAAVNLMTTLTNPTTAETGAVLTAAKQVGVQATALNAAVAAIKPLLNQAKLLSAAAGAPIAADDLLARALVVEGSAVEKAQTCSDDAQAYQNNADLYNQASARGASAYYVTGTGLVANAVPIVNNVGYEMDIAGNDVSGRSIAGIVRLAELSLGASDGHINFIDYATGEFYINGRPNVKEGQRIQINDPVGRYGRAQSAGVLWSADPQNPTIRATTGFPMCIPRTDPAKADDPLCPQKNRVKNAAGVYYSMFEFPDPQAVINVPARNAPVQDKVLVAGPKFPKTWPDACQQAPFEVGDHVNVLGNLFQDVRGSFIAAHTVEGNLGLYTASGTLPAYIGLEVALQGVGGIPPPTVVAEVTARTRVRGFTTDVNSVITVFGLAIEPCTGDLTRDFWATSPVDLPPAAPAAPGAAAAPVLLGTAGRWRVDPPKQFLPIFNPVKYVQIVSSNVLNRQGTDIDPAKVLVTANGLPVGQYLSPIGEYIFPEIIAGGAQPTANLDEFPFLTQGQGPWLGGDPSNQFIGPVVGPLVPFPHAVQPVAPKCSLPTRTGAAQAITVLPPIAMPGADITVQAGTVVTLDGSASIDQNDPARPLTYSWRVVPNDSPLITLATPKTARQTFTTPKAPQGLTKVYVLELTVSNGVLFSAPALVRVTAQPGKITLDALVPTANWVGTQNRLVLTCTSTNLDATARVFASIQGLPEVAPMEMTRAGAGFFTLTATAIPNFNPLDTAKDPQQNVALFTSNLGAKANVVMTVTKIVPR
ncbi:hypothetical protein HDU88_006350 [Geranomyces variabilis]|nr:hypothetical protein HDU88_006350 [Geranomyces variabilis]